MDASRRQFMGAAGAALAGGALPVGGQSSGAGGSIPKRPLGRTGEQISSVGLGGYHIGVPKDFETSQRIIRTAVDSGITFMDNCWDYHEGKSEEWMGRALGEGYRKRVFLMSKIDGRDRKTAAKQIDESLRRLQADVIDLMQLHEVSWISEPLQAAAPGGSLEALAEAKKAGKVRFIGFTGHKNPKVHLWMLKKAAEFGYRFDAVQMPLNLMDAHYNSFEKQVLPELVGQGIGVLGMKPMGGGHLLKSGAVTAQECLRYALSLPTSVVITGCDTVEHLQQAIDVGRAAPALSSADRDALLARTKEASQNGRFELYKTTHNFDGVYHNPHWMG